MQKFIATMKHKSGPKAGQQLSRARIVNVLQVLKTVWDDDVSEHHWQLPDPFAERKKVLPKKKKKAVQVFRFAEWEAIIEAMEEYYRPVAKLMTGTIASEIVALKTSHIRDGYLSIEESIVRKVEKDDLKNEYRGRRIQITAAVRKILDLATARATGDYLFTMENGMTFTAERF